MVKDSIFAKIGTERNKEFSKKCIDFDINKSDILIDAIDDFNEKTDNNEFPDWIRLKKKCLINKVQERYLNEKEIENLKKLGNDVEVIENEE